MEFRSALDNIALYFYFGITEEEENVFLGGLLRQACMFYGLGLHQKYTLHQSSAVRSSTRVLLSILCAMFINLANSSSIKFGIEIDVDKMIKKMLGT